MEEKLIGQAERTMLGNDLYWDFIKLEFRIDYANCNVYELVGED